MSKLSDFFASEEYKNMVFYDGKERPTGSNADEWAVFLEAHRGREMFISCQIAEAIEVAEQFAIERALSRMGWPEVHAYEKEWNNGQQDDDAGGYWIRCLSRLFGVKRPLRCAWEIGRHQRAAAAMVKKAAGVK